MIGLLSAAAPFLAGILGFGGGERANRANAKQARDQMAFQERMSSTAVERSVQDYKKAGLNPALAYDRSASSPSGAAAQIGNSIEQGVSGARSYVQGKQAFEATRQALVQAAQQNKADLAVKQSQVEANLTQAQKTEQDRRASIQMYDFNKAMQPHLTRQANAQAILTELGIPAARNTAQFEEFMGRGSPGLKSAKTAAEILHQLWLGRK